MAQFGAGWLGWDVVQGRACAQPNVDGLAEVTATPAKYGLHATLKPPFRLAQGSSRDELEQAVAELAARCAPARCDGLELTPLGRFLALTLRGDTRDVARVASACVRDLDTFRAAPEAAELARRRSANLSAQQDALLTRWGYPYVMEAFRFHITLTGRVPKADLPAWRETVAQHLPDLPAPFVMDQIALCGERPDGRFEVIHRYTLAG